MLKLNLLAARVRDYSATQLAGLDRPRRIPGAVSTAWQALPQRLMTVSRKLATPELPAEHAALLLSQPHQFMHACWLLAGGAKKKTKESEGPPLWFPDGVEATGAEFINLDVNSIEQVGVFHTCNPYLDWLGLLADIGRGHRLAHLMNRNLVSMLAGPRWVIANSSLNKGVGHELIGGQGPLSHEIIKERLDLNALDRLRLYSALGIPCSFQDVPAYDEDNSAIHRGVLEQIADYYLRLAIIVYGVSGELTIEQKAQIAKANPHGNDRRLPENIRFLYQAGHLTQDTGEADLAILARIAEHFSRFDRETFIYYFAQLFGQRQYLGKTVKTAVLTEKRFDGALHDRQLHIHQRWGNGGPVIDAPLAAAYDLQYELAGKESLPYMVLSLGVSEALRNGGNLAELLRCMCPLRVHMDLPEIVSILKKTGIYPLNRLLADLSSYLLLCHRKSPEALKDACKLEGLSENGLEELFSQLGAADSWLIESQLAAGEETGGLWMSWLIRAEWTEDLTYTPLHLWFVMQCKWSDAQYELLAKFILVIKRHFQLITQRNWVKRDPAAPTA